MSEPAKVILEGEVVEPDAITLARNVGILLSERETAQLRIIQQMTSLDWKDLKPPQMALLLMQKPFKDAGGGSYNLTPMQALVFAQQAYDM